MQIISSYGVELRKQNIPIRQTLRSTGFQLSDWDLRVWEELAKSRMQRGVLMLQNIWYTKEKYYAILISGSQRCLPICADLPSSMHWDSKNTAGSMGKTDGKSENQSFYNSRHAGLLP